jgi:hypothetical protein
MKNSYRIEGDMVIIYVRSPKYGMKEILVDLDDFHRINQEIPGRIYVRYHPHTKDFYAQYRDGYKKQQLHQFIMNFPTGWMIDHRNHHSLDNRKCNLRMADSRLNQQNRKSQGVSKYPGVVWYKRDQKWKAQIHYESKTYHIGYYEFEEDASAAYQKALSKLDTLTNFTGNPFLKSIKGGNQLNVN